MTYSLESAFVRAYAAAAVGVQAVLDAAATVERITRPLGHDADEPLPDCEPVSPDGYYGYAELGLDESSAVVSRNEPAERPPEVDSFPPNPSGGPPAHPDDAGAEWVGWAVPAICTVLAEHTPYRSLYERPVRDIHCAGLDRVAHAEFSDWQAWHEHVAPLIAVHLESALAHEFPASK